MESNENSVYNQQFLDVTTSHIQMAFDSALTFVTVDVDRRRLDSLRRHILPGKMLRTRLGLALWARRLCTKHTSPAWPSNSTGRTVAAMSVSVCFTVGELM